MMRGVLTGALPHQRIEHAQEILADQILQIGIAPVAPREFLDTSSLGGTGLPWNSRLTVP